jgi:hypothetical protein
MNSWKELKIKNWHIFKMILYVVLEDYWKMFESFKLFYFEDFDKYCYALLLIAFEELLQLTWCINFY